MTSATCNPFPTFFFALRGCEMSARHDLASSVTQVGKSFHSLHLSGVLDAVLHVDQSVAKGLAKIGSYLTLWYIKPPGTSLLH